VIGGIIRIPQHAAGTMIEGKQIDWRFSMNISEIAIKPLK
jgi:hypothetical protein